MTDVEIQQHITDINQLSQFEMCRLRRFAHIGHPYFNSEYPAIVEAFEKRFEDLGGMTPEISKALGW